MDYLEEFRIPEEAIEQLKDPDVLHQQVTEGKTFQEILGYSYATMEKFYHIAYQLFQCQEYRRSADAFIFLTTLNPYVFNYWLGLGMAEQLDGQSDEALMAYGMATLTNPEHPVPHYHSGRCYLDLGNELEALTSLDLAIDYSEDDPEFTVILERAIDVKLAIQSR